MRYVMLMRGKLFLTLGLVLTASCSFEPEGLDICEDRLKSQLKSPGTYERVEVFNLSMNGDRTFIIDFDSQNGFGALIRGKASCQVSADGADAEVFIY